MTTDKNNAGSGYNPDAQEELSVQILPTEQKSNPFLKRRWVRWTLGGTALATLIVAPPVYESENYHLATWYFTKMAKGEIGTRRVKTPPVVTGPYAVRTDYANITQRMETLKSKGWKTSEQNEYDVHSMLGMDLHLQYEKKAQTGLTLLDDQNKTLYSQQYPKNIAPSLESIAVDIVETLCFVEDKDVCDPDMPTNANPAFNGLRVGKAFLQSAHILPGHSGASTLAVQYDKFMNSPNGQTVDPITGRKSFPEKIRQWGSASRDAYASGPDTRNARKKIILDYLNAAPFAGAPGWGEVHGIADALGAFYGTSVEETSHVLSLPRDNMSDDQLKEVAVAYRQVLSLVMSLKMGSKYMNTPAGYESLQDRVDNYIPHMVEKGHIKDPRFADMLLRTRLKHQDLYKKSVGPAAEHAPRHKAVDALRIEIAEALGLDLTKDGIMHDMDKFDLKVSTTIDKAANDEIRQLLHSLKDPEVAKKYGITGDKKANPALLDEIVFSFLYYKSNEQTNDKVVQVDTNTGWLDVSQGTQLQMGSTMKPWFVEAALRGFIYEAHKKYESLSPEELKAEIARPHGPLTLWTLQHLATEREDKSVTGTLETFVFQLKKYSTNPNEMFFTGGGMHRFKNYRREDDSAGAVTLALAMEKSHNLPHVRLVMDMIKDAQIEMLHADPSIYTDMNHPMRAHYVEMNAHTEGIKHLSRYWHAYKGKTPEQIADALVNSPRKKGAKVDRNPVQAAVIFRSIFPDAPYEEFESYVARNNVKMTPKTDLRKVYDTYSPDKFTLERKKDPERKINYLSLMDRGYLAGINELALVVAIHQARNSLVAKEIKRVKDELNYTSAKGIHLDQGLQKLAELEDKRWDMDAWKDLVASTTAERKASAEWIISPKGKVNPVTGETTIKPGLKKAQDKAIRVELEYAAFREKIHPLLVDMGYPFPADNPSAAWVLGGTGNTQKAQIKFQSNVQHDGLDVQDRAIVSLEYAEGVKTFNRVATSPIRPPKRVTPVEVAQVMQKLLRGVAERGTLKSIEKAFEDPAIPGAKGAKPAEQELRYLVSGKTGTSRNEKYKMGPGGSKTVAESKSLTSTVMFMVTDTKTGQKYQGVMLAYVLGSNSAKHHFSSALSLAVVNNVLAPTLKKLMETPQPVKKPEHTDVAKPVTPQTPLPTIPSSPVTMTAPSLRTVSVKPDFSTSAIMDYNTNNWYLIKKEPEQGIIPEPRKILLGPAPQ